MNDELRSMLIGTAGLGVLGVIAIFLTVARGGVSTSESLARAAARLAAVTILLQATHFAEELATGFHRRFPELLGLAPWSPRFFVSFNLLWIVIWGLGAWGLRARLRVALFPLWFLGLGCAANALAHPLLSISTGGYFPGLATSPIVGVVGVLLLRRLFRITGDRGPSPAG